jgi:glycosyltransferase 2 family protein
MPSKPSVSAYSSWSRLPRHGRPEEYGGGGVDDFRYNLVMAEELQRRRRRGRPRHHAAQRHLPAVLPLLLHDEQKQRWLPGICSGELITAIAMTEPGIGSDLASMTTTAIRDGDHYVVNGSKTFITNGINADLVITAVKTDPTQRTRASACSCSSGAWRASSGAATSTRSASTAQDTAELFFNDVRVPVENLLGEEGEGFRTWCRQPAPGAAVHRHRRRGARPAALDVDARVRARSAPRSASRSGAFQNTRFVLAEMETEVEIGQAFVDRACSAHNAGELTAEEAAMAKWWCTELQKRVVDQCVQLHGGYGYMLEYPIARAYADARITDDLRRHHRDHEGDHRPLLGALIEIPLHLSLVVAIGAFAGSVAVLITGAPPRRIDPDTLRVTLAGAGVVVTDLEPVSEVRGLVTFRATGPDVPPSFVRVLGREERDGDLLLRSLRSLRVKGMGDDRPSGSPRRVAEHAVLAQALTARAGVRLPAPTAVALTGEGAALIVEDWVDGARLDELGATDIGDALLHNLWREVAVMQRRRIAHRALNASNIRVTGDDAVLVDFRQADLSAPDHVLGADVAELLTSIATIVGAERVVTVAAAELGPEALARALPLLQPVVLTPRTRAAAKAQRGLLDDLRSHTQVAAGVEEFELAQIHRITLKGIVSLVGSLVLAAYLFNLVADWSEIWAALQTADLTAVPWLVVFYVMGTVGGALSMMGSVTQPLPLWQTSEIMIAQSFLNRFTPANAGGMALRARYLQLSGVDLTVAAAAVGLTSVASGVAQFLLIVVFFVWGGQTDAFSEISLPSVGSILLLAVAVGALGGAIALTGWGKRTVVPWVKRTWNKAFGSFRQLGSRPDLLGKLFGGTFLGKFANLFSFYVCVLAFGVDMPFSQAGAVYMVGNTIGSAVPTPGGVGGVEAALTAALLSVNVDPATAAAIVLLFRLFTFWLPTIPGWFFLQRVQRQGIV